MAEIDPAPTTEAGRLDRAADALHFARYGETIRREYPTFLHGEGADMQDNCYEEANAVRLAIEAEARARLDVALQTIIDLPTVVPDHPHGGVHPPYLEWVKVAAIARAALARQDARRPATFPLNDANGPWCGCGQPLGHAVPNVDCDPRQEAPRG